MLCRKHLSEYIDIKGEIDYFVAKEYPDTYIAVWLEEGKDFETVLWEETKQKVADLNPMLLDERAVEVKYQADPSDTGGMMVTLLGKADELGTFVLKMSYNEEDFVGGRMCHNLANEFIPLNKKNLEKLSQVKPLLVFDYDQSQYELVQYTSNPNGIYAYYFDQSIDEKLKEILDGQEQRRQHIMSMFEGREDEATGLTTMSEEPSEINTPSRKLVEVEDDTQSLWRTIYLVDDGMGGCYEIYIYLPEHEDLKAIIDSLEIRQELPENMEYRTAEDNTLG